MIGKLNHCDMVLFSDSQRHKQSQARELVNDLDSPVVCVMFVASAHHILRTLLLIKICIEWTTEIVIEHMRKCTHTEGVRGGGCKGVCV